jgi:hypothetical protein
MDTERPRLGALMAVATGGCFCEHCSTKAKTLGYDWDLIVKDIRKLYRIISATNYKYQDAVMENHLLLGSDLTETGLLTEFPGMWEFINFRIDCMTKLFEDISGRVHSLKKDIDFRFNNCFKLPEFNGYSIKRIAPYIDSLRDSDYLEQYGNPGDYAIKRNAILNMRRGLGFDKNLLASIPIRPNATPEIIRQSLKVLKTLGIDGISLAHYDSAYLDHLDAFGLGLKEENYVLPKAANNC